MTRVQIITLALLFIAVGAWPQEEDMRLTLESDKDEYIAREPIKFIITMTNISDQTLRIPEVEYLGKNMEHMLYEITYHEDRMLRIYQYMHNFIIPNPNYVGEALNPGDSIQIFLYPNFTRRYDSPVPGARNQITFKETGNYEVRVVYYVDPILEVLWKPRGGKLYSNPLNLRIREPTREEREILDAIWSSGPDRSFVGPARGDDSPSFHDEPELRRVISKYPDHPMIKHAYLALAKSLSGRIHERQKEEEAAKILEMMMDKYPEFRYEEVRLLLGYAYWRAGKQNEAVEVFNRTLDERPSLRDNYRFMRWKLRATYGPLFSEAFYEWKRSRKRGEIFDEDEFKEIGQSP
jgi:hypothetical protein